MQSHNPATRDDASRSNVVGHYMARNENNNAKNRKNTMTVQKIIQRGVDPGIFAIRAASL